MNEKLIEKIPASTILQAGKEVQDLIQCAMDPDKTEGYFAEAQDLWPILWNMKDKFPVISDHVLEFLAFVQAGAELESLKEYCGDWIEWDVDIFTE